MERRIILLSLQYARNYLEDGERLELKYMIMVSVVRVEEMISASDVLMKQNLMDYYS